MKKSTYILCVMFVVTATLSTADAAAPALIPVQGVLTHTDGTLLDEEVSICFTIHDAETEGNDLWTETQTVTVENGLFTVYLGEVEPLDLSIFRDKGDLWLGTTVGDDPEMSRVRLGSAPFSGFAEHCGNLDISGETGGIQYNGLKDFRLVFRDDFEAEPEGWQCTETDSCDPGECACPQSFPREALTTVGTAQGGITQILGGYQKTSGVELSKTFDLTNISHSEVMVRFDYYALDSWDGLVGFKFDPIVQNEYNVSDVVEERAYAWTSNGGGWSIVGFYRYPERRTNFTGTNEGYTDAVHAVEMRVPHSGDEIVVGAGSTLDSEPGDESFGIDNVEIWVR